MSQANQCYQREPVGLDFLSIAKCVLLVGATHFRIVMMLSFFWYDICHSNWNDEEVLKFPKKH